MRISKSILLLYFAIGICGCTTYTSPFVHKTEAELEEMERKDTIAAGAFASGNYAKADGILKELVAEPTVSRPLYELERVSVLLQQGKRAEAHELMMKVRSDMELLFDEESEEKAMSLWHGENNKVFKGDVHERATLYVLLAMSFMEMGEWEDAERCVKNGLLADSANTENEKYNSDYALLQYLGYVCCRNGGRDSDAEEYVREMKSSIASRNIPMGTNTAMNAMFEDDKLPNAFLVVWSGTPPSYVRGGEYEEVRYVVPGKNQFSFLSISTDNNAELTLPRGIGDINYQAKTRGGRNMDSVLANKAAVKTGMKASGNLLLVAGFACLACMGNDANTQLVMGSIGGGCILLGCTFHIVGACINSKADIRHWKNLPGEFLIIPMVVPESGINATVRGYKIWDNIATKRCRMVGKSNAISVHHLSMLNFIDMANPVGTLDSRCVELNNAAKKDPRQKYVGEIPYSDKE